MAALTGNPDADRIYSLLAPELKKLCTNATPFCDLTLTATLHDNDVVRVSLGVITSRKVAPSAERGGRL